MPTVLVIDDDRQVRRLIRQILGRAGYEVVEAENGVRGLEAFSARPADLVVIDLYMPERGGWETIRALQRVAPGVPFVVVSGGAPLEGLRRGSPGTLDSLRGLAAFRVLRKPIAWRALTVAVGELLSDRHTAGVEGR